MKKSNGKNSMMPGKMPMTNDRKNKSEEMNEPSPKKEKKTMKKPPKGY